MTFPVPAVVVLRSVRCVCLLGAAALVIACSNDVDVGSFGGGGSSATTTPGEAGGAPTGTTTGATSSGGGGDGGADTTTSSGGGEGGSAPSTSTGEAGATGAGGEGGGAQVCGGLGNLPCDADAFCDFPDDAFCGGDDSTGVCADRPTSCPYDGAPACGCDGDVHINGCYANLAGTDVSTAEVPCGVPCGGISGAACEDDELCKFPEGSCGFADEEGVCVKRPTSCEGFPLEVPICACDGETYDNECEAAAAGFDVWSGEDLCQT